MEISDEDDTEANDLDFKDKIQTSDIGDLFQLCNNQCNTRYLSVLLYLTLRRFNLSYRDTHAFLKDIGGFACRTAQKWSNVFVNGKFDEFVADGRGGKRGDSFYDVYPDLEAEARAFAVLQCEQKAASFTAIDLAQFVDKRYYEINDFRKTNSDLVRSVESCRLDLRRWGGRFEANSNRPYFEGHDRPDVVAHRHQFIDYFLTNEASYYTISPAEDPSWQTPKAPVPTILICHDESTFRSGDVRAKRWVIDNSAPFFSKG
ncbi:unnamed protein product, partial [Didymodactylos carnosus]